MCDGVAASAAVDTVVTASTAATATQAAKNASRRRVLRLRVLIDARWLFVLMVISFFTNGARWKSCGFDGLGGWAGTLRCRMSCRSDRRWLLLSDVHRRGANRFGDTHEGDGSREHDQRGEREVTDATAALTVCDRFEAVHVRHDRALEHAQCQ